MSVSSRLHEGMACVDNVCGREEREKKKKREIFFFVLPKQVDLFTYIHTDILFTQTDNISGKIHRKKNVDFMMMMMTST